MSNAGTESLQLSVDDNSALFLYAPTIDITGGAGTLGWSPSASAPGESTTHTTSLDGASLAFQFNGTGIQLLGNATQPASYEVTLDGVQEFAADPSKNLLLDIHDLPSAAHTVTLTARTRSTTSDLSLRGFITFDKAIVSYPSTTSTQPQASIAPVAQPASTTHPAGTIAALVLGGTAILLLLVAFGLFFCVYRPRKQRRRRERKARSKTPRPRIHHANSAHSEFSAFSGKASQDIGMNVLNITHDAERGEKGDENYNLDIPILQHPFGPQVPKTIAQSLTQSLSNASSRISGRGRKISKNGSSPSFTIDLPLAASHDDERPSTSDVQLVPRSLAEVDRKAMEKFRERQLERARERSSRSREREERAANVAAMEREIAERKREEERAQAIDPLDVAASSPFQVSFDADDARPASVDRSSTDLRTGSRRPGSAFNPSPSMPASLARRGSILSGPRGPRTSQLSQVRFQENVQGQEAVGAQIPDQPLDAAGPSSSPVKAKLRCKAHHAPRAPIPTSPEPPRSTSDVPSKTSFLDMGNSSSATSSVRDDTSDRRVPAVPTSVSPSQGDSTSSNSFPYPVMPSTSQASSSKPPLKRGALGLRLQPPSPFCSGFSYHPEYHSPTDSVPMDISSVSELDFHHTDSEDNMTTTEGGQKRVSQRSSLGSAHPPLASFVAGMTNHGHSTSFGSHPMSPTSPGPSIKSPLVVQRVLGMSPPSAGFRQGMSHSRDPSATTVGKPPSEEPAPGALSPGSARTTTTTKDRGNGKSPGFQLGFQFPRTAR